MQVIPLYMLPSECTAMLCVFIELIDSILIKFQGHTRETQRYASY